MDKIVYFNQIDHKSIIFHEINIKIVGYKVELLHIGNVSAVIHF